MIYHGPIAPLCNVWRLDLVIMLGKHFLERELQPSSADDVIHEISNLS
jgi:hypothetical protein